MCWVMPPRSPAATVVLRIASRRLVLPWSTWPMTVTMGARETRRSLGSSPPRRCATLAASAAARFVLVLVLVGGARLGDLVAQVLGDQRAVSRSTTWLMVAKMPLLMSSRMMSAGFTPSSSASSLTVIVDGSSTAPRSLGSIVCDAARRERARTPRGLARAAGAAGAAPTPGHEAPPSSEVRAPRAGIAGPVGSAAGPPQIGGNGVLSACSRDACEASRSSRSVPRRGTRHGPAAGRCGRW